MDVSVIGEETLLSSVVEVSAVIDCGLLAGGTTEDLGLPGVQVAVEVNDTDRTVVAIDGAEKRKCDCVVTSESDKTRQCLTLLGRAGLIGVGVWCAAQEEVVALLDLLERKCIVVSFQRQYPKLLA